MCFAPVVGRIAMRAPHPYSVPAGQHIVLARRPLCNSAPLGCQAVVVAKGFVGTWRKCSQSGGWWRRLIIGHFDELGAIHWVRLHGQDHIGQEIGHVLPLADSTTAHDQKDNKSGDQ